MKNNCMEYIIYHDDDDDDGNNILSSNIQSDLHNDDNKNNDMDDTVRQWTIEAANELWILQFYMVE